MAYYGWQWRPYVPVAQRRAKAMAAMERMRKKGANIQPVRIAGRDIAKTFWGRAWCEHLEKFSDFANRLPRGRTYVRNGSVCHLEIGKGRVAAKVSGSQIYNIEIKIKSLARETWRKVRASCAGQVGSLLELLQGKLSDHVMGVVTDRDRGLFPTPKEISLNCSCPDWADMCKHVAAVMYGVGARLDEQPELLFLLRGVNQKELVSEESAMAIVGKAPRKGQRTLSDSAVSDVFGIDLAPDPAKGKSPADTTRAGHVKEAPRSKRRSTGKKLPPSVARIIAESTGSSAGADAPTKTGARSRKVAAVATLKRGRRLAV